MHFQWYMAATKLKTSGFKGTFEEGAKQVAADVRAILKNLLNRGVKSPR